MKKFGLIFTLFLIWSLGFSQYYLIPHVVDKGNPGGLNTDVEYPEGSGLSAGWTKIDLGAASTPRWTANQTIPFTFTFNGNNYNQFKVSTSGILTFDVSAATAPAYTKAALPDASIPDNSVCIWGLAGLGTNDYIFTKVFGTTPNRQLWIHFNSYSYSAKTSDGSNYTYWAIVLEETTNKIYIMDQRTGGYTAAEKVVSAGIQIDGTTAVSVPTSPNLVSLAGTDATAIDNVCYEFIPGTQPQYDFTMYSIDMLPYQAMPQKPFTVTGTLFNYGSATITSFDINYSINNGTPVTATINSVNIKFGDQYSFSHPTKWNPGTSGVYSVKVWASNLNGNADENTTNDSKTKSIEVVDNMAQRIPLLEVFTSSTCPPCNPGNANIKTVMNNYNRNQYTMVKYQQYYPGNGDPYFTMEGYNRHNYYNINSVPRLEIDGQWDKNPNAPTYNASVFDGYAGVPSFVQLNAYYWLLGKDVKIHVDVTPLKDFTGDNRVFIAVIEKTTYQNVKSNGETEFYNVMKKMLPTQSGGSMGSLTKGQMKSYDFSWSFPGSYRLPPDARPNSGLAPAVGSNYDGIDVNTEHSVEEFTDLDVVVWVQNYSTKEVLQSTYASDHTFIPESGNEGVISLYPNPASHETQLSFAVSGQQEVKLNVVNTLGQTVMEENFGTMTEGSYFHNLDVSSLANGAYILKLDIGGKVSVVTFIVNQ
ncbi:MAG TPA: T9SS type A sorting domain-containing protein [Bacteroidia bacterium]|nr:T9SS type A sorting domain-containing protein [Bacteroidia bacterium]HRS59276.1 T9SS type A sorting domain-containing protein [Bacteroidia bacterium]HRU67134.1 T9SS type A sorting domain-containing protein [Bacteroidia bacterium]